MGLDIFIYKVKKSRTNNMSTEWRSVYNMMREDRKKELTKVFASFIKKMQSVSSNDYTTEYIKAMKKIAKRFNYTFTLAPLGYVFKNDSINPQPIETLETKCKKVIEDACLFHCGYFRKVNFLYKYFYEDLVKEACYITPDEVQDIITKCNDILKGDASPETTLPTTSGFFFGSTAYDEWYYEDVRDVLKTFKQLSKDTKEDEILIIEMSW